MAQDQGDGDCPRARRWLTDFARNRDWRRFAEGRSSAAHMLASLMEHIAVKVRVRVLASFVRASYCNLNLVGKYTVVKRTYTEFRTRIRANVLRGNGYFVCKYFLSDIVVAIMTREPRLTFGRLVESSGTVLSARGNLLVNS